MISSQLKTCLFIELIFLSLVTFSSGSFAKTYNSCSSGETRTELDNVCPMVEGATLPQCCPQAFGSKKLSCTYKVILSSGQPIYQNGSYTTCEGGMNVQKPCCNISYRSCFEKEVTLQFIPRLIHRSQCCLEGCPSSKYWVDGYQTNPSMPQNSLARKITSQHSLSKPGDPSECINETIGTCNYEMCKSSNPCPLIPNPNPNPAPGPGPSPNPNPSPDPGPSPQPDPDPTPPGDV